MSATFDSPSGRVSFSHQMATYNHTFIELAVLTNFFSNSMHSVWIFIRSVFKYLQYIIKQVFLLACKTTIWAISPDETNIKYFLLLVT